MRQEPNRSGNLTPDGIESANGTLVNRNSLEAKLGLEGFDVRTREEKVSRPQENRPEDGVESNYKAEDARDAAKNDLDFLSGLAMPLVTVFLWPPVFKAVWEWLTAYAQKTRDFSQLVLGLPRGFGKTTLIKLFILYCILFTKKKFILVINAREDLAV